jgi:hypothetical protein
MRLPDGPCRRFTLRCSVQPLEATGGTAADIDLLVLHQQFSSPGEQQAWDDQLALSGEAIHRGTGNWLGWFQISEAGLSRMVTEQQPIVEDWRRDAITLVGRPLIDLLRTVT